MSKQVLNQSICLKASLFERDYNEINRLKEICISEDKTTLKLGLGYKLNQFKQAKIGVENINEFLYYIEDELVAYLGISSFGSHIGEICGMTHPDWRRRGLFRKLLELAVRECEKRNFNKVLLLTDGKSDSGHNFIEAVGGNYECSEYRMKLMNQGTYEELADIDLRKSNPSDRKEIKRQDAIFIDDDEESEELIDQEAAENEAVYMIERDKEVIGKIRVEYNGEAAAIYGFGILPDFRGKGYGKAALKKTLKIINEKNIRNIELDVACKNNTALNLYKACGFEEKSVMNYYKYDI